jgi:hypothetical protein
MADLRNLPGDKIFAVPFGTRNAIALALVTLVPLAPLLLTTFSAEELLITC